VDAVKFFKHPKTPGQKQYEALRAYFFERVPGKEVARRFGYTYAAFNSLKQKFKKGAVKFFITSPPGPKGARTSPEIRASIIEYRRKNLSAYQIAEVLDTLGTPVSISTISRILDQEGFPRLKRRTQLKIGLTKDNTIVPEYASPLEKNALQGWEGECTVGGIFLLAPLIEHSGLPKIISGSSLPSSGNLSAMNYVLSILALKLIGKKRLSQVNDYNFDQGLGLFAGLNVLPKSTAISTYSYRLSPKDINNFMASFVQKQNKLKTYSANTINLDFHTIQHYGEESVLDKHWAGARNQRVKGALTFIAQDCLSQCQLYVQSDVLKSEADDQILEFVKFWKRIRGKFRQTLVFDSKLATYDNLAALNADGVKFITLRRRGNRLIEAARKIPAKEWKKLTIDSPKRKYKNPYVHDSVVQLKRYGRVRQLILKGNGREEPSFFITNDFTTDAQVIIEHYAKRWRVENSIEKVIAFFNLNALSSPILIRIHFDVLLTMIADTLYYYLAQSLKGFENCKPEKIFRHFVDMPARIKVTDKFIVVRYPLRSHNPVLRAAKLDKWTPPISWLGNRKIQFKWE